MTIKATLKQEMKNAMKAKEKMKLETVRALLSALQYEEMSKKTEELSEEQALAVLKAERKKLQETREFAEKAGRSESVAETEAQISVIDLFLPSQLARDQIEKIISDFSKQTPEANMGTIMKHLQQKYSGQYDGKVASEVAREVLSR